MRFHSTSTFFTYRPRVVEFGHRPPDVPDLYIPTNYLPEAFGYTLIIYYFYIQYINHYHI